MYLFERFIRAVTSDTTVALVFVATLFFPAIGLLLDFLWVDALLVTLYTVLTILILGLNTDNLSNRTFHILFYISFFIPVVIYGYLSGWIGGVVLFGIQAAIYRLVISDFISSLNIDVSIILKHHDDLYKECIKIEKSK